MKETADSVFSLFLFNILSKLSGNQSIASDDE